jgi:hypothetical protein
MINKEVTVTIIVPKNGAVSTPTVLAGAKIAIPVMLADDIMHMQTFPTVVVALYKICLCLDQNPYRSG